MKVKELVTELLKADQELDVFVSITDEDVTQHFDIDSLQHWDEGGDFDHLHIYAGFLVSG